ncbi:MAG: hypothetical protein M3680_19330 [Myxococcota bacterium]|nr:hypothetical protein [Myxococcota bacterium]
MVLSIAGGALSVLQAQPAVLREHARVISEQAAASVRVADRIDMNEGELRDAGASLVRHAMFMANTQTHVGSSGRGGSVDLDDARDRTFSSDYARALLLDLFTPGCIDLTIANAATPE